MIRKLLLYAMSMLLLFFNGYGQQYPVKNYRIKDGMASSIVFRCYQDKRGFMWFCTNYGLNRFDGRNFRTYNTADGLVENTIMSMSDYGASATFVSTYGGGLVILDDSGMHSYHARSGTMPGKILYTVQHASRIWLISTNVNTLYSIYQGTVTPMNIKGKDSLLVRFFKASECRNELLLSSSDGLYKVNKDGVPVPFMRNITEGAVNDVKQDRDGSYWLTVPGRVVHTDGNKILKEYPVGSKLPPGDILIDHNGNIWIAGAGGGVFLIQHSKLRNITDMLGTGDAIVQDIFEDKEGNIWLATGNQGVYLLRSLNIVDYPIEQHQIKSYCKSVTRLNDTEVVAASMGTLNRWANGSLHDIPVKMLSPVSYIYFVKYLNDNLYIGTAEGMIVRQMKPPYKEQRLAARASNTTGILSFLAEKDSMWLGSFNAVYRLNKGTTLIDSSSKVLDVTRCICIYRKRDGTVLFGTNSGYYSYANGAFSHTDLTQRARANAVKALLEDSKGTLWFATDSGLVKYNNEAYTRYTEKDGLTCDKCNALHEDHGRLWIATGRGLSMIDLNTGRLSKIRPGLFENEVLSLCTLDSILFAGMVDRLSVIRQKEELTEYPPQLYITAVKWGGSIVNMPASLRLPYNRNKLNIAFSAPSYSNPESIQYRYRITTTDDNWHITTNNEVDLQSLPAGDMDFMVSTRINGGMWSNPVILPIHVDTPLWQNKWLIALVTVLICWFIYFMTKRLIEGREEKKRQQLSLYNRIVYLKQQALGALINPHFIFNCMNSIQHYMHGRDHYTANLYLADFAQLIRATLDQARSAFIPLEQELYRLKLYLSLEQLRFGDELKYELKIDDNLDITELRIPNMIIQPYIENAIWHGIMPNHGVGLISISFSRKNDKELWVQIKDNGIGIEQSRARTGSEERPSLGMKLTADRLDVLQRMLGQHFSVHSTETTDEPGKTTGTLVTIILPLQPDEERLRLPEDNLN